MTLDELDRKAGELFKLMDKDFGGDPRVADEKKILMTGLMIAVELIADVKRMTHQFELLNKGLLSLIDLKAAEYQNGILVKVQAPIEIFSPAEEANSEEDNDKAYATKAGAQGKAVEASKEGKVDGGI